MSVLDSIYNYNERLVIDEIHSQTEGDDISAEKLGDIACLALNQLPAKYIKHGVDRAFYTGDDERVALDRDIKKAVAEAISYIATAEH